MAQPRGNSLRASSNAPVTNAAKIQRTAKVRLLPEARSRTLPVEGQREKQRGLGASEGRQHILRRGGEDRAEEDEQDLDDLSLHGE